MTDYVPNFILKFQFNSLLGILLFWVPLAFCLVYRTVKVYDDVRTDIYNRNNKKPDQWYKEIVTVGYLVIGIFLVITPLVNVLYAVFTTAPAVLSRLFTFIDNVLNQPLIPRKNKL